MKYLLLMLLILTVSCRQKVTLDPETYNRKAEVTDLRTGETFIMDGKKIIEVYVEYPSGEAVARFKDEKGFTRTIRTSDEKNYRWKEIK